MGFLDSVLKEIQNEAEAAMNEAEATAYLKTLKNVSDFYSQGKPKYYERTKELSRTPKTTGVRGDGNHFEAKIYLDSQYSYDTGSYTAAKVMSEAEVGGSGILGKPGFWAKSEKDIEEAFYDALKKRFD